MPTQQFVTYTSNSLVNFNLKYKYDFLNLFYGLQWFLVSKDTIVRKDNMFSILNWFNDVMYLKMYSSSSSSKILKRY